MISIAWGNFGFDRGTMSDLDVQCKRFITSKSLVGRGYHHGSRFPPIEVKDQIEYSVVLVSTTLARVHYSSVTENTSEQNTIYADEYVF